MFLIVTITTDLFIKKQNQVPMPSHLPGILEFTAVQLLGFMVLRYNGWLNSLLLIRYQYGSGI